MSAELTGDQETIAAAAGWVPPPDYRWTEKVASTCLPPEPVSEIVERVRNILRRENMSLPDEEFTVTRSVTALFVGNLILQGPPGTGKTTLARALTEAFRARLTVSTATSEWSPFHVVGGLRPTKQGGLESKLGVVPTAVLDCAASAVALNETNDPAKVHPVADWLLIDEFNRADIDKAIGSLYTVLSSSHPSHLAQTPIELWFESAEEAKRIWVPASFRIIGTMNDLDTSYVSPMSQGLRRRFQFITLGVPSQPGDPATVSDEIRSAFDSAMSWAQDVYDPAKLPAVDDSLLLTVQNVFAGLRQPQIEGVEGWPVGTAQAVDVFRSFLLAATELPTDMALDLAIADRVIAQMNVITRSQFDAFGALLRREGFEHSARELAHLYRPYSVV